MRLTGQRGWKWLGMFPVKYKFVFGKRVGFMHADDHGAPVLKTEASWRTWSALYVRVGLRVFFVKWRGFDD